MASLSLRNTIVSSSSLLGEHENQPTIQSGMGVFT